MSKTRKTALAKKRSSLSKRMKKGELYVVYSGLSDTGIHLISYRDPKRTPRIYKRDGVDSRLCNSLPICRNMATAEKMLGAKAYAVLLPLADMVVCFGEREVRSWARLQEHVTPAEVRNYVSRRSSRFAA